MVELGPYMAPIEVNLEERGKRKELAWKYGEPPKWGNQIQPTDRVLYEFIELSDGNTGAILSYARRWGVLHICQHNYPASHNPPPFPGNIVVKRGWCSPVPEPGAEGREAVAVWVEYARQARALLDIVEKLNQKTPIEARAAWEDLGMSPALFGIGTTLSVDWNFVALFVGHWLWLGNVRPSLAVSSQGPSVELAADGLFGVLACQLLQYVGGPNGVATCTGCRKPYRPRRQPSKSRNHYCQRCGKRGSWRDSKRKLRALEADVLSLASSGRSLEAIAECIGRTPDWVKNCLQRSNGQKGK